MLTNWSFSKLMQYEQCPLRVKFKVIDRIPEPPRDDNSPLERGNREHNRYENYVKGDYNALDGAEAKQFDDFRPLLDKLFDLYAAGKATAEDDWTLNADWDWCDKSDYWLWSKLDFCVMDEDRGIVIVGDYKGLPLDTVIPVPGGFIDMASIEVDDVVFDKDGKQCRVIGKSKVKHLPCYEILFDDTTRVTCDAEHLWTLCDGSVVRVTDMKPNMLVPTANAVEMPHAELPIDPYVFGLWIADGKHTSAEISKPDQFIWDEIQRRGYEIGTNTGSDCPTRTVKGIRGALRALGVLGNKHIPPMYMWASVEQRQELVRGIFDGDGYANHLRHQANLNTNDPHYSDQVMQLLRSLGQRPTQAVTHFTGFGKKGFAFPVSFRPRGFVPFLLPRKANGVSDWGDGYSWRRRVVDVREVESVPTQCIAVDSPSRTFLCTDHFIPTHNTGKSQFKAIEHVQQTQLYAALAALKFDWADTLITELWYVDEGHVKAFEYGRDQALTFVGRFQTRVDRMMADRTFRPSPNAMTCRWCPYGSKAGNGHCPVSA